MFDAAFRTLFLSTPVRLSLVDKHLCIAQNERENIKIPFFDILCIILESPQITLTNALLNALTQYEIICYTCDSSHLPSGVFIPFLGHFKSLSIYKIKSNSKNKPKSILS